MIPADPFAVVKECKGAALSVLILLSTNRQLGGGAVTQEWLERHSGYTDKPISQALAYLSETGRITHTLAGWVLAEDLPASLASPEPEPAVPPVQAEEAAQADISPRQSGLPSGSEDQRGPAPSRRASRELSDSPATTSAIDLNLDQDEAEVEERGVGIIPTQATLEHVEANLAAFKKWGVGRNEKTIVLSARPEVTPGQIDAIAKRLISERRFSTGLLITAVQCDDQPVPNAPNKYALPQAARDPRDYADWEE